MPEFFLHLSGAVAPASI